MPAATAVRGRAMRVFGRSRLFGALCAALFLAAPAGSAAADESAPEITQHRIQIGGKTLAYTAEAGRLAIRDVATGEPVGHIFYVAYRAPAAPGAVRPIAFIWNGGPGMPAASLNFEGFGPRRIEGPTLVDNADTLLTDADLVFMDPVGTGFSRAVSPQAQEAFTSIVGDVAATTEFIRGWVLLHGAEEAPLIVAGQSYGAGRAGAATYQLIKKGLNVRGLALISNTSGMPRYVGQELIAPAVHVADYAVAALYFNKLPSEFGTTPDAARTISERWARETYLPALKRRDVLTPAERAKLITDLARHIGLAESAINPKTLGLTQSDFLGNIMPGQLPYYSDYRKFEPYKAPPLGVGVRSIRHELGYASDLPYLGVEPIDDGFAPDGTYPKGVNATWTHSTVYGATPEQLARAADDFAKTGAIGMGHFGPDLPSSGAAIALKPSLKVLVAHGAYDPLGGCSMDAEMGRQLPSPYREAVTWRCYISGHAIYRDAPARGEFANDLRALARAAAKD
jgi:carboxypeptidase C (cathepsin A)